MTPIHEDLDSTTLEAFSLDRADRLVDALKKRFDMDDEDASAIATIIAEQFRGDAEVNDDHLDPEVRSIFYTLESKKLLSFRREEYSIDTGERRRAFFWRLRDDELKGMPLSAHDLPEQSVYDALPKEVWARNAS